MTTSKEYVMGSSTHEQQRLLVQARQFDREARWLLDQISIEPGWRVADMGCGPIGILDRLAERVGPTGHVVGVEREAGFIEIARSFITEQELPNVDVLAADATATGLPDASFDLVHERLTLLQQPGPDLLLREMIRLTRPGGVVALQDIDTAGWLCEPPHPAWQKLVGVLFATLGEHGVNPQIGRRLPALLRTKGLENVKVDAHLRLPRPGEYLRTLVLSLVESVRQRIIERRLMSEAEFAEQVDALRKHLEFSETLVVGPALFQAWGRKPG